MTTRYTFILAPDYPFYVNIDSSASQNSPAIPRLGSILRDPFRLHEGPVDVLAVAHGEIGLATTRVADVALDPQSALNCSIWADFILHLQETPKGLEHAHALRECISKSSSPTIRSFTLSDYISVVRNKVAGSTAIQRFVSLNRQDMDPNYKVTMYAITGLMIASDFDGSSKYEIMFAYRLSRILLETNGLVTVCDSLPGLDATDWKLVEGMSRHEDYVCITPEPMLDGQSEQVASPLAKESPFRGEATGTSKTRSVISAGGQDNDNESTTGTMPECSGEKGVEASISIGNAKHLSNNSVTVQDPLVAVPAFKFSVEKATQSMDDVVHAFQQFDQNEKMRIPAQQHRQRVQRAADARQENPVRVDDVKKDFHFNSQIPEDLDPLLFESMAKTSLGRLSLPNTSLHRIPALHSADDVPSFLLRAIQQGSIRLVGQYMQRRGFTTMTLNQQILKYLYVLARVIFHLTRSDDAIMLYVMLAMQVDYNTDSDAKYSPPALSIYSWQAPEYLLMWKKAWKIERPLFPVVEIFNKLMGNVMLFGTDPYFKAMTFEQYINDRWPTHGAEFVKFIICTALLEAQKLGESDNARALIVPNKTIYCPSNLIGEIPEDFGDFSGVFNPSKQDEHAFVGAGCVPGYFMVYGIDTDDCPSTMRVEIIRCISSMFRPDTFGSGLMTAPISQCKSHVGDVRLYDIGDLKPLRVEKSSCWTSMFNFGFVLRQEISPARSIPGLEMDFQTMMTAATTHRLCRVDNGTISGYILLGYFTALVPVRRYGDTIIWHFEYSSSGFGHPSELVSLRDGLLSIKTEDELYNDRCVIGMWPEADILVGTKGMKVDFESSGIQFLTKIENDKGFSHAFAMSLGFSNPKSPLAATVQYSKTRNIEFLPGMLIFPPDNNFITALNQSCGKIALVYDNTVKIGWLVPQISLLFHLCRRYSAQYSGDGESMVDQFIPDELLFDGFRAAKHVLYNHGMFDVSTSRGTGQQLLLRDVFLRLWDLLKISDRSRPYDSGTGSMYFADMLDFIEVPAKAYTRELKSPPPSVAAWRPIVNHVDSVVACRNFGKAIKIRDPTHGSGMNCSDCQSVPEQTGCLVAHAQCLNAAIRRDSIKGPENKLVWHPKGGPFSHTTCVNGSCWNAAQEVLQHLDHTTDPTSGFQPPQGSALVFGCRIQAPYSSSKRWFGGGLKAYSARHYINTTAARQENRMAALPSSYFVESLEDPSSDMLPENDERCSLANSTVENLDKDSRDFISIQSVPGPSRYDDSEFSSSPKLIPGAFPEATSPRDYTRTDSTCSSQNNDFALVEHKGKGKDTPQILTSDEMV
ncbi:hypothetical protein K461DRAFT_270329 [Myriangium duriaei CBS 260.36]|uniref:Uncharacterized protein n=1 Tax=Myriangium duriaei CBS 260.36 TaxID=1168546 RepID=A0A9P4IVU7_9PEZI|nr:hypothetical protein K461DRAFT_270329 [Myriangium duriaei CBS 260.36]